MGGPAPAGAAQRAVPIKYLQEKLPNKAKLGLYFNPLARWPSMIDDCIACGCDKLIEQHGGMAWDEAGFEALKGMSAPSSTTPWWRLPSRWKPC